MNETIKTLCCNLPLCLPVKEVDFLFLDLRVDIICMFTPFVLLFAIAIILISSIANR